MMRTTGTSKAAEWRLSERAVGCPGREDAREHACKLRVCPESRSERRAAFERDGLLGISLVLVFLSSSVLAGDYDMSLRLFERHQGSTDWNSVECTLRRTSL